MKTITFKSTGHNKRGYTARVNSEGKKILKRPAIFQHIRTGTIVSGPSITAACRKMGLKNGSNIYMENVLKQKRLHYKGWGLPKVLNAQIKFKDLFQNKYEASVRDLANKISSRCANALRKGKRWNNLAAESYDFGPIIAPKKYQIKQWRVKRGNRVYVAASQGELAQKIRVSQSVLSSLMHGKTSKSTDGFVAGGVVAKPRFALDKRFVSRFSYQK